MVRVGQKKTALLIALVLIGVVLVSSGSLRTTQVTAREAVPPLPHEFYGNVTVNAQPAQAGVVVEARGERVSTGVAGNPMTTTEVGRYGGPAPYDLRLIVQGEDIRSGDAIEFYVDGTRAECYDPVAGVWVDVYPFKSGVSTALDLWAAGAYQVYLPFVKR